MQFMPFYAARPIHTRGLLSICVNHSGILLSGETCGTLLL